MKNKVAIIMGSQSDWETMKYTKQTLTKLKVKCETKIVSAHRTPNRMVEFAKNAHKKFDVIVAGAGGAAHLPGMVAAITSVPVLGVPIPSKHLNGNDSLLSIVQMPAGIPVGTLAIGQAGAVNAALLAAAIIGVSDGETKKRLDQWREKQTKNVADVPNG